MKSLANLVAFLFLSAIFSGSFALGLTFLNTSSRVWRLIRRIGVLIFACWGIFTSVHFLLGDLPLAPRTLGLAGSLASLYALKREFFLQKNNSES